MNAALLLIFQFPSAQQCNVHINRKIKGSCSNAIKDMSYIAQVIIDVFIAAQVFLRYSASLYVCGCNAHVLH